MCACALFSLGLILVSSGWAPAISRMLSHRPVWSVCGQALCDCRPLEMPEDCPLCVLGLTGQSGCSGDEPRIDPGRVALRQSGGERFVMHLGTAAESLMAGLFLLGGSASDASFIDSGVASAAPEACASPGSRWLEIPTPPPRA